MRLRVHEIKKEKVIIDMNRPLAGKTPAFEVKIIDIQAARKSNLPW